MVTDGQGTGGAEGGPGAPGGVTRRDAGRIIAAAAGMGWVSAAMAQAPSQPRQPASRPSPRATPAGSQPPTTPSQPATPGASGGPPSFLDKVITKGRQRDWVLRSIVHLDSFQEVVTPAGGPGVQPAPAPGGAPGSQQPYLPKIVPFKFDTAGLLFPCLKGTAGSETDVQGVRASVKFDNFEIPGLQPTVIEDLPGGARYQRWDLRNKEGRQLDLEVELPVTCWEVRFDDKTAAQAVWPASGKWPREAQLALGPQMGVEAGPVAQAALKKWTSGKPAQEVPPVALARFLASKVMEIQPNGDGLTSSRTGLLQGFVLQGSERTLETMRGSEHDIACALAAVYRAAGLPARTVIGYDVSKSKGEDSGLGGKRSGALRSWVEFCLYDEPTKASLWVPVDVMRQRRSGNVPPQGDRPWRYFGGNDETDDVVPLSFHYHPPMLGALAHGSPCLWGWITTPESQTAEQTIRFIVNTAVRRPEPRGPGRK